jgi:protein-L-isoaspartate(D-aspartate) O-methyltransferase
MSRRKWRQPASVSKTNGSTMIADYAAQRLKMVDGQLRTTDVTQAALLDAMLSVPRELFVPEGRRTLAYIDEDILVNGDGAAPRFLMEPSPFARLVQLARIAPDDFVLDVGCATGYSAAVLSRLASSVVALESEPGLADAAGSTLSQLGYDNVAVVQGPLEAGYQSEAPYDVIVIEGAVELVPEALLAQLKEGGRLVAVVGTSNAGAARLYVREGDNISGRRAFNAAVKALPGFERAEQFQF